MTFEEDFPSWKGFDWGKFSPYQVELIKNMLTMCDKDKQKVRDAIKEIKDYVPRDGSFPIEKLWIVIEENEKRLGL